MSEYLQQLWFAHVMGPSSDSVIQVKMDLAKKPGDAITVEAYRAKDGSNTANAAQVTLADGRKVFAGSPGTPAGTPGASPQER